MEYNVLLCISEKTWVALDVNNGQCDRISMDGNETVQVSAVAEVKDFCTHILNYYNISDFHELEINVKIVTTDVERELVFELCESLKAAKRVELMYAETILPICVLKKCVVKGNTSVDVEYLGREYTLQVDEALCVSYREEKAGQLLAVEPEDFSFLVRFDCTNLISDEKELEDLKKKYQEELSAKQEEVEKLKQELAELKKSNELLQAQAEKEELEMKKKEAVLISKRTVVWYSTEQEKHAKNRGLFGDTLLNTMYNRNTEEGYNCTYLVKDGDIVKQGKTLAKVSNGFYEREIKAPANGRVFLLPKKKKLTQDTPLFLLADPSEEKEAVMEWYNKMK